MNPTDESRLEQLFEMVRDRILESGPDSILSVKIVKGRDDHIHLGRCRIVLDQPTQVG